MEFVGDIARKTGQSSLLAIEAVKASKARQIGKTSGLFTVPDVVNFDSKAGVLEFERLRGLSTLLEMAVHKKARLNDLLDKAGQSLAVIHEKLVLPEEMKHELPPEWMDSAGDNVFIHGDYACINVCFHEPSEELVILDWSAAPMVRRTPTFGCRYFDILLFISSLFHGAPCGRIFGWNAAGMAETFLEGYRRVCTAHRNTVGGQCPPYTFQDYSPEMCRLQRQNIKNLARQRSPIKAPFYMSWQMLMQVRFRSFLRKRQA